VLVGQNGACFKIEVAGRRVSIPQYKLNYFALVVRRCLRHLNQLGMLKQRSIPKRGREQHREEKAVHTIAFGVFSFLCSGF
jgi:hypothetical protein